MSNPDPQDVLHVLKAAAQPFSRLGFYSTTPGIYGVYLCGSAFIRIGNSTLPPTCLLYIGKTESSQVERDAEEHFSSEQTGHSALRRPLGALLRTQLDLTPRPRSHSETTDRRFTNYRFDDDGERRLTSWMSENLALSFYECQSPEMIRRLEKEVIALAAPPLDIDNNPRGCYKVFLRDARADCAELARGGKEPVSSGRRLRCPARPSANRMFLHDAIADVLGNCPQREASCTYTADEIARRGTYPRPKDGRPPEPWQVRLRAGKPQCSHLFEVREELVRLR